jgi:hypothetical protein
MTPASGKDLEKIVPEIVETLGLKAHTQFKLGHRIWGAQRHVDVLVEHPTTHARLGIECKFQASRGSADEKLFSVRDDIATWPIRGIVVYAGEGFDPRFINILHAQGIGVALDDLPTWLCCYFNLPFPTAASVTRALLAA